MSTWTVGEEEEFILDVLKRYDPKVDSVVERCHHARLHETVPKSATDTTNAKETLLAQGPVYVVKRHGRSMYNLMLLNRKASTDPSKETLNVWTAAVPLGPSSKLEVVGPQLFINCARTLKDFRLHFTEPVDVERMTKFCQSCKASNIGDLRSLLSMSTGSSSSLLTRSLDKSSEQLKVATGTMQWSWLAEGSSNLWPVPDLLTADTTLETPPITQTLPISTATPQTTQKATGKDSKHGKGRRTEKHQKRDSKHHH
jgi:hypothetical protein